MDPLSVAASIASLLDLAESVAQFAVHMIHSKKEMREVRAKMETPIAVLKRLQGRTVEAQKNPSDPWFQGMRLIDPTLNPKSPIARLEKSLRAIQELIEPPKAWKKETQTLRWHWSRDKIDDKFDDIQSSCALISSILAEDQFDLTLDIQKSGSRTEAKAQEIQNGLKTLALDNEKQLDLTLDLQLSGLKTAAKADDIFDRVRTLEQGSQQQLDLLKKQEKEKARKKRNHVAEWLSPFRFLARQQELSQKCYPIGRHVYESEEFVAWARGAKWQLYLRGDAGTGKTCLSAIIIDRLQKQTEPEGSPVLCLYLDHKDQRIHTKSSLLGSLLKQLIQRQPDGYVPPQIQEKYDTAPERPPALADIESCLKAEIANYDRVYLVVDGLDECSERIRLWLMEALPDLESENLSVLFTTRDFEGSEKMHIFCSSCKKDPIKLFWSCRRCKASAEADKLDICKECLDKGVTCGVPAHGPPVEPYDQVYCDITFSDDEIASFVDYELQKEMGNKRDWDLRARRAITTTAFGRKLKSNPDLCTEINEQVVTIAGGRMIFATLCLDSLKGQRNVQEIRKILRNLSASFDALYDGFMKRIEDNEVKVEREAALDTFSVLSCCRRAVTVEELLTLLALRPDDTEYDSEREYDKEGLLDWTKNLIVISDRNEGDDICEEARLFHSTFDTYLEDNRSRLFGDPHALIAKRCLAYLRFAGLTEPLSHIGAYQDIKRKYPLVAYAAQFWGEHIRLASSDEGLTDVAIEYMSDDARVTASMQLAWCAQTSSSYVAWDLDFPRYVTNLHLCAWAGLTKCLEIMARDLDDVDVEEGNFSQTPLMLASRTRNTEMVSKLLELHADVNRTDTRGKSALVEAIEHKRDKIVARLIQDKHLSIDTTFTIKRTEHVGRTPLMIASRKGFADVVEVLLTDTDINVNMQDPSGLTALMLATESGSERTVQILLGHPQTDVLALDRMRQWSALTFAAKFGHTQIAESLLAFKDGLIRTHAEEIGRAFFHAFASNHVDVVKTMIANGADPMTRSDKSRSLLHIASYTGHTEQIAWLVSMGLNINATDDNLLTPLHQACCRGHFDAVKELVSLGADTSMEDKFGRTAAKSAWLYGKADIFEILNDKNEASGAGQAQEFREDDLPAWSLAKALKHHALADSIRSGRLDISENEPLENQSALQEAIDQVAQDMLNDQLSTAEVLLEGTRIDINHQNFVGRTALHHAAYYGNVELIQLLCDHDANVDARDKWDYSPLYLAWSEREISALSSLIEFGAEPYTLGVGLQEIFFALVEHGSAPAVKRLLLNFGADPLEKDERGRTSYDIATKRGDIKIVSALQASRTMLRKEARPGKLSEPAPTVG